MSGIRKRPIKKKSGNKTRSSILFKNGNNSAYLCHWVKKTLHAEKNAEVFKKHLDYCWIDYWKDKKYWGDPIAMLCRLTDYSLAVSKKSLTQDDIENAKGLLETRTNTKEKFISLLLEAARESKDKFKIPIAVTLSQSALETRWGKSVKNNNYFGIKGEGEYITTHEVINGKRVKTKSSFRKYESPRAAVLDHGSLLSINPKYKGTFKYKDDPYKFCDELQKAGYATDTEYAKKLQTIIKQNALDYYDEEHILD
ncbi:MAG: glucosaminidase domain-containing protein [Deltaproteobacteria bacterium]|nr:glucosaminidase domain-containing protein [Deltaproteobacteria bacterium]